MIQPTMTIAAGRGAYPIAVESGAIARAAEIMNLKRKCLIVTDSGVPSAYAETVAGQCDAPFLHVIPQGEGSKNPESLLSLLRFMMQSGFDRSDCVVAVGGGVVGDLAGFAASCYMRGIDFYNIPTTLLSQVDSSIGGKTAIDLDGMKNIVGAFYPPKAVVIDPRALSTLPARQTSAGMAEVIKMAVTSDAALFDLLEESSFREADEEIIVRALRIKKNVVERDERESGLRKILNFGHTLGHGIESERQGTLLHGECVALGMLPMSAASVRNRLIPLLRKYGLPTSFGGDPIAVMAAVAHDKKSHGATVDGVFSDEIGTCRVESVSLDELRGRLRFFSDGRND